MRYIYYIIAILVVLSALVGYELMGTGAAPKSAAIIVNNKVITTGEFNKLYSSKSADADKDEFINSMITKELLIQESQRQGIDKEESFRRSIRNFYEQSLIKLLMDRQCACLNVTVTDDELKQYIALLGSKIHFTMFSFGSVTDARRGDYKNGEGRTVRFEDLSKDIRSSVVALREGKMTEPFKTGEKYVVIRLDKIERVPSPVPPDSEKNKIKEMLKEEKKEKKMNEWISELRRKASVKVLIGGKN